LIVAGHCYTLDHCSDGLSTGFAEIRLRVSLLAGIAALKFVSRHVRP
jgi:hypothetical protein